MAATVESLCHARAEDFLPRICADGADGADGADLAEASTETMPCTNVFRIVPGKLSGVGAGPLSCLGQIRAICANPRQKLFALPAVIALSV